MIGGNWLSYLSARFTRNFCAYSWVPWSYWRLWLERFCQQ